MGLPFGKRWVTLVWCLLECLFFSGLLNGWAWMQQILTEDGYFLDYCNISHLRHPLADTGITVADYEASITKLLSKEIKNRKCVTRRVLKVIPKADLKLYMTTTTTKPHFHSDLDLPISKPMTRGGVVNGTVHSCNEQADQLELVISLVIIIRNILMLPLGIFLDKYGTMRTRLVAMSCSAFGSLTMLFSGEAYPWLIFPALLMLGVSGLLVLLTDLQISNMFGPRRYTLMSMFVGSYFSGGIVIFFMRLTKYTDVNLQTSFMFITIGIVPILISTIAMLPRSRIPWPMPATYRKGDDLEKSKAKAKAWQRRISVGVKKRTDASDVFHVLKTPLYIFLVVWFSIISLKSLVYEVNIDILLRNLHKDDIWFSIISLQSLVYEVNIDILLRNLHKDDVDYNIYVYAVVLLFSLPASPLIGFLMDCTMCKVSGRQPHVQQMCNILYAVCLTFAISLLASVVSLIEDDLHIITFILLMLEKVALHATFFAFLTHVHFPSEHFGKYAGVAIATSGLVCVLQYPIKLLLYHTLDNEIFYINLGLLIVLLLALCHPISVWINCKEGVINDTSAEREPQKSVTIMLLDKNEEDDSLTRCQSNNKEFSGLQVTDL